MARSKRISFMGYPHLVIAQSNSDNQLFIDEEDYLFYLERLKQMVRDRLFDLYAFCLQPKELRLVIKPTRLSLARVMQRLHCSHTQRINKRLNRRGNLFCGRFWSMVFPDVEIINAVRSIHLWPVRAGLIRRPESYAYSSHNTYVSMEDQWQDMIDVWEVIATFGSSPTLAKRAFSRFVESVALDDDDFGIVEASPGIGGDTHLTSALLERAFTTPIKKRRTTLRTLSRRLSLLLNLSVIQLRSPSRRQDLVMARRLFATAAVMSAKRNVSEVALFLHRDKAQVSRLVSQGIDLLESDEAFKALFDNLRGPKHRVLD